MTSIATSVNAPCRTRDDRAHRVDQPVGALQFGGQQVSNDLGIGLGLEVHARLGQLGAQIGEVLDNAVVDHGHSAVRGDVRVRVLIGGCTVGGPSGVPDALMGYGEVNSRQFGFEIGEFAGLLRDTRRPSATTAMPAESYPRYSRRRSPEMMTSRASRGPT